MEYIVFPEGNRNHVYSALAAIMAMLAAATAGYLWLPRAEVQLPLVADCRLDRQPCEAGLPDGGRIAVAIEPRPVPKSGPMRLSVQVDGLRAERAEVDFQGVDMNMGLHRLPLSPAGAGRFAAETTLPVCVTGRMIWQATVQVESGRKNISVPFRFESGG